MTRRNLHVFPTNIESQTRLFKEAEYTLSRKIVDRIVVLGLWHDGQQTEETMQSGLEVVRVKTALRKYRYSTPIMKYAVLRKMLAAFSLIQYCAATIKQALLLKPQYVSCHYVGVLPLSWVAARLTGATLEYLPHELETQRTGLSGFKKRIETWIEQHFIRSARNVVVVCDPIRDWYQDAYGLNNIHVVRNVPEKGAVNIRAIPSGGFRKQFKVPDSAKIFIYQGLFSAGRGIEALLDTFATLDARRCHLVLMGYGEDRYQEMINDAAVKHSNIHYQPAVARELIVSYSASADVGIFISERASLSYRYALPNKFFEWAHAGLPILVSDNLEYQAQLVHEGGFGWATPLGDLTAAVMKIADTDLAPYAENARRYALGAVWDEDAKTFARIYRARSD